MPRGQNTHHVFFPEIDPNKLNFPSDLVQLINKRATAMAAIELRARAVLKERPHPESQGSLPEYGAGPNLASR
jgi:hypothetical protein